MLFLFVKKLTLIVRISQQFRGLLLIETVFLTYLSRHIYPRSPSDKTRSVMLTIIDKLRLVGPNRKLNENHHIRTLIRISNRTWGENIAFLLVIMLTLMV